MIRDGILVVNKPKGITSHDVVDFVRKKLKIKQVGHAGTLDPIATGVLVILIGKCTKLFNQFLGLIRNIRQRSLWGLGLPAAISRER